MAAMSLQDRQTRRDWMPVAEGLMLAAFKAASLDLAGMYESIRDGFKDSKQNWTIEEKAGLWLRTTAAAALLELLNEPQFGGPVEKADRTRASDFLAKKFALMGQDAFDRDLVSNPVKAASLEKVLEALPGFVREGAPGTVANDEEIRRRYAELVRYISARVFALKTGFYQELVNALEGPFAEAFNRDQAWARHANWIVREFHEGQVFAPKLDKPPSLAEVYHPLRCYWHEEAETGEGEPKRWVAHVGDLHGTLHDWLRSEYDGDPLRVVAGGPGSGKSTLARAFSAEVVAAGRYRVVWVPLQHLSLSGELKHAIATTLSDLYTFAAKEEGFEENPLKMRVDEASGSLLPARMLLVFDGLDELSRGDKVTESPATKFIEELRKLLKELGRKTAPLRALVLGRSVACQEALADTRLNPKILLHVAPLTPIDAGTARVTVDGNKQLANNDERPAFWKRSALALGLEAEPVPEAVTSESVRTLNAEPLLLHLLIVSGYAGERWREAAENRNRVFQGIFEAIFERDRDEKQHPVLKGIEKSDYFALLECLGLAAWRDNARTGSQEAFDAVRKLHANAMKVPVEELRNVAVLTYTRREFEGQGFEFVQKSLGEYLIGRGLLSAGARLKEMLGNNPSADKLHKAAEYWTELVERGELTEEILRFLRDEARLQGAIKVGPLLEPLGELFNWTLTNGMPAHKTRQEESWRQIETAQRCAEAALLAVADAVVRVWRAVAAPESGWVGLAADWKGESRRAFHFVNRIRATSRHPVCDCLACLNLRGADLMGADLRWKEPSVIPTPVVAFIGLNVHFDGANLAEANLSWANLSYVDLSRADLRGANLSKADLGGADLSGTDLSGANLRGADLSGLTLKDANLRKANLSGANLRKANLSGLNLNHANLYDANLNDANLYGADLSGANLRGADLSKADLSKADLRDAVLDGAVLSDAKLELAMLRGTDCYGSENLSKKAVDAAFGVRSGVGLTHLPEGMEPPRHWHAAGDRDSPEEEAAYEAAYDKWRNWIETLERLERLVDRKWKELQVELDEDI